MNWNFLNTFILPRNLKITYIRYWIYIIIWYPISNRIYFKEKISSLGGQLDIDKNAGGPITTQPLENIFYAVKPPAGKYSVIVSYYKSNSGNSNVPYVVYLKIDGQLKTLTGVHYNAGENHSIYEFIIP
jgi:uncharacterized protein YfaP (DUF2135 family)